MAPVRACIVVALLGCIVFTGCLEDPPDPASSQDPKPEALAFSLAVVETYLASDYARFRGMLADELYTLEGDGPLTKADVDATLGAERPFPAGRDYSGHTMEEYHEAYAPEVLTFDEVRARYPEVDDIQWPGWTPDGDDLVFLGSTVKEGRASFLWDDLLAFAVTRETGEWRLKALSS